MARPTHHDAPRAGSIGPRLFRLLLIAIVLILPTTVAAADPSARGACCLPDGSCRIKTRKLCAFHQGAFRGRGKARAPTACLRVGACCQGVLCSIRERSACKPAGAFKGLGSTCSPQPCVQVRLALRGGSGACCIALMCEQLSPTECFDRAGYYHGDGTACDAVSCEAASGACCFASNNCRMLPMFDCGASGGGFLGQATTCQPHTCITQAAGPCCKPNGSCVIETVARCFGLHGSHRGPGVACEVAACRQPAGACCSVEGCQLVAQSHCAAAGGQWIRAGFSCNLAACPRSCACDWNGDGTVDINDFVKFASDMAAGISDFNLDGRSNERDLREFVDCWRHPPYGC